MQEERRWSGRWISFEIGFSVLCLEAGNLKVDVMKQAPPTASGKLAASALDMRLKGGAMETIYIGVDFHARQQTICYLTTETGEFVTHELKHKIKTKYAPSTRSS